MKVNDCFHCVLFFFIYFLISLYLLYWFRFLCVNSWQNEMTATQSKKKNTTPTITIFLKEIIYTTIQGKIKENEYFCKKEKNINYRS